jgi:beta-lactamase superfamily II metal-dependent hydrolase
MTRAHRFGVALLISGSVAAAVAQQPGPPQAPAKPDTQEIKTMIERLRTAVGPRWAYAVHFWCEEPRANRPDDPAIPPTKIFDNVFAIGNSGTTVYALKTSSGLLMIDALGGNDAQATTTQVESQLLPGFQKLGLDPAQVKVILVTHGHADHFGGASYFQEHYGLEGLRLRG